MSAFRMLHLGAKASSLSPAASFLILNPVPFFTTKGVGQGTGLGVAKKQPLQSPPVKPVRSSETILLVEDEAPVREITTLLLVSLGYQVQVATSGEEALRLARGNRKKIDLLITDVLMPGMSGSELAEVLRARDAGLKVLFLSGHSRDTVVRRGVMHTEVAFLQKPSTLDALSKKLREVFASD